MLTLLLAVKVYQLIEDAQRAGGQLTCPYCDHTMAATKKNKGHLQNHLYSKHKVRVEDMKLLKGCEWCQKTFSETSSLRRHMKMTHAEGNRELARFHCPVCPAPFTTEITMKARIIISKAKLLIEESPFHTTICILLNSEINEFFDIFRKKSKQAIL